MNIKLITFPYCLLCEYFSKKWLSFQSEKYNLTSHPYVSNGFTCSFFMLYVVKYVSLFAQVTYMLSGVTAHEDSCGHSGKLEPGDLQVEHFVVI